MYLTVSMNFLFIIIHDLLISRQSGFRLKHSSETVDEWPFPSITRTLLVYCLLTFARFSIMIKHDILLKN